MYEYAMAMVFAMAGEIYSEMNLNPMQRNLETFVDRQSARDPTPRLLL